MWCLNKPYAIVCSMQIFYAVAEVVVLSGIIFFGKKSPADLLVRISHSDFKVKLFLCVNNERQKKASQQHSHTA